MFISAYKPAVSTLLILTLSIFEIGSVRDFVQFVSIRDLVQDPQWQNHISVELGVSSLCSYIRQNFCWFVFIAN